jgi:hypothetical protein
VRVVLLLLVGCSWSDAITRMSPTPDPTGPCLQITHAGSHRWDLYKGEHRVGANMAESYELAYADHAASEELIASSQHYEKLAGILGASGMVAGIATLGAGELASSTVTMGIGGGLMVTSFVTAGVLAYLFDARWGDSVDEYNTWAAAHGCH